MPDYGHDLLFGTFVPPAADASGEALRLARLTGGLGLDLVSVRDLRRFAAVAPGARELVGAGRGLASSGSS